MKRFFISAIVTMGCFMAHAQSVTIPEVSIVPGGEKSVDVTIAEGTKYTAFQFDVALPTGVSLKSASFKGKGATREITSGKVDGKYRVLSYDTKNEKLGATEVLSLTFEAETSFAADGQGTVAKDDIVLVDPEGKQPETVTGGTVAIKVAESVSVTVGAKEVATYVGNKDLDFTDSKVKAYIATGYDYKSNDILLTRVMDVPANTPILLLGGADTYKIPVSTSRIYYPDNFMKGNATAAQAIDHTGKYINMQLKSGEFIGLGTDITEIPAGKCYLQIPASVTPAAGDDLSFTMGANGIKSYTGKYDLDFTGKEVKAYVVTGYDKDNTIWLTRVMKVSANTPLVLLGEANKAYTVPSTEQKTSYVNMLRGDANNATTITKEANGFKNLLLKSGQYVGLTDESVDLPAGLSYLPVPKSILAASRGEFANEPQYNLAETEVITMKAIIGGENDGTTGIKRVDSEVDDDVWYNLKGQRIDTPTRKGLYIKNGKKVVVK